MHPTTRIVLYILSALALPGLNSFLPPILALPLLILAWPGRRRLLALLWRVRWLFLILVLVHAYQLPGEAFWPPLGVASPSREGMLAGLLQAGRLLILLMLLEVLVLGMPVERLVCGVHGLLRPFSRLGLDPNRATLRLALTLHAMERRLGSHVLHDLIKGRQPGHDLPDRQPLLLLSWHWLDGLILVLALLGTSVLWLSA